MGAITDKEMGTKANGRDQWFTDPAPRGSGRFVGRITAKGERSFYFRYTNSTGKRDTLLLGHYDPRGRQGHLTLAGARALADTWARFYTEGARDLRQYFIRAEEDRLATVEAERELAAKLKRETEAAEQQNELARQRRKTVRQVFDMWAAAELKPQINGEGKRIGRKDGGQYVREQFKRRVFDSIGDSAIVDVSKPDILAILDSVKAEGKLRTANVLLADLKQMFRFAVEYEHIIHSPIESIRKKKVGGKDVRRSRVLSDKELRLLIKQLPEANLGRRTELGIWIILATGCRIGELMGAVWADVKPHQAALQTVVDTHNTSQKSGGVQLGFIDLNARTWFMPTTKNQRNHLIHLSDFAMQQFSELYAMRGTEKLGKMKMPWVFPDSSKTGPVCVKSFGKQLADRQRGEEEPHTNRTKAVKSLVLEGGRWTAHDLRRTTSTMMSQLEISTDVINECQNHIKPGMSGLYIQDRRVKEQAKAFELLGAKLTTFFDLSVPM